MTADEWQAHACQCRQVAATIEDVVARQILLEAADDYMALASRETMLEAFQIPAYQAAAAPHGHGGRRDGL